MMHQNTCLQPDDKSARSRRVTFYRIDVTLLPSLARISHRVAQLFKRYAPTLPISQRVHSDWRSGQQVGPYQRLPEVGGGNGGAGWLGPSARGTTGERVATILLPNSVAQGDLGWPGLELRPAQMQTNWAYLTQHDTEQNSTHRTATSLPVGGAMRQSMATLAKP